MFIVYIIALVLWILCGVIAYGYHKAYTLQRNAAGEPETLDKDDTTMSLAVSWLYCYIFGPIALVQVFKTGLNVKGWYRWVKKDKIKEKL